jgi:hypothetical protein
MAGEWLGSPGTAPVNKPPALHTGVAHVAPQCRVAYAGHDPIVLAHARSLLTSTPLTGRTG